ncbi:hypothetical protein BIY27_13850 [Gibbsiella quercinecans]|nr:hypothetical protein BIY27_13850 [Gibbsiella quercinecans]
MLNKYRPTRRRYQLIDQSSFTFPVMARRGEYAVLHINNDHSFILYAFPSVTPKQRIYFIPFLLHVAGVFHVGHLFAGLRPKADQALRNAVQLLNDAFPAES